MFSRRLVLGFLAVCLVVLAFPTPAFAALTTAQRLANLEKLTAAQTARLNSIQTSLNAANANIKLLQIRLATANNRIASLETTPVMKLNPYAPSLNARITSLETTPVMKLNPYVLVSATATGGVVGPNIFITGANLHIRSGAGNTEAANGKGNLIVGYDEMVGSSEASRTGSHNVVIGPRHKFTSWGGLIGGRTNSALAPFAVVFGNGNTVSANGGSITGGQKNIVEGWWGSISGGFSLLVATVRDWATVGYGSPTGTNGVGVNY
jgi:hypothetical protein